jgi:hypothetical protein
MRAVNLVTPEVLKLQDKLCKEKVLILKNQKLCLCLCIEDYSSYSFTKVDNKIRKAFMKI